MQSVNGIVDWIHFYANDFHRTTLGNLVTLALAVLKGQKLQCAAIASHLEPDTTRKHRIRRVWRWCSNSRVSLTDHTRFVLAWASSFTNDLLIQMDWTEYEQTRCPTLMFAVVYHGRALPLYWETVTWDDLKPRGSKKQCAIELRALKTLTQLLPLGINVILLADRGFRRVPLLRWLEQNNWKYIIRTTRDARFYRGKTTQILDQIDLKRGQVKDLGVVGYTFEHDHPVRIVACRGARSREPWYLLTNLDLPAQTIQTFYGKRFKIEELFRDQKSHKYGFGLSDAMMRSPEAYARLWLLGAMALLLACVLGKQEEDAGRAKDYQSNTRYDRRELSIFRIGLAAFAEGRRICEQFLRAYTYCET